MMIYLEQIIIFVNYDGWERKKQEIFIQVM